MECQAKFMILVTFLVVMFKMIIPLTLHDYNSHTNFKGEPQLDELASGMRFRRGVNVKQAFDAKTLSATRHCQQKQNKLFALEKKYRNAAPSKQRVECFRFLQFKQDCPNSASSAAMLLHVEYCMSQIEDMDEIHGWFDNFENKMGSLLSKSHPERCRAIFDELVEIEKTAVNTLQATYSHPNQESPSASFACPLMRIYFSRCQFNSFDNSRHQPLAKHAAVCKPPTSLLQNTFSGLGKLF